MEIMTPELFLKTAVVPALSYLRDRGIADTLPARRMMLAIPLQESGLLHRRQVSSDGTESGPASSFFQFESGPMSGCNELLVNPHLKSFTEQACRDFNVVPTRQGIWQAIQFNDVFAVICARLLLYMLPKSLPTDQDDGWAQYVSAWHPGSPHPKTWPAAWATADRVVKSIL